MTCDTICAACFTRFATTDPRDDLCWDCGGPEPQPEPCRRCGIEAHLYNGLCKACRAVRDLTRKPIRKNRQPFNLPPTRR